MSSEKKKKRISKFCSWLDCIENPFLRVNSFSCPSLHNFLSCSKSGFGIFFSLQGRRRVRELSSEQSLSGVPGGPGATRVGKLFVGGQLHIPSHMSANLNGQFEWGKDFFYLTSPKYCFNQRLSKLAECLGIHISRQ